MRKARSKKEQRRREVMATLAYAGYFSVAAIARKLDCSQQHLSDGLKGLRPLSDRLKLKISALVPHPLFPLFPDIAVNSQGRDDASSAVAQEG